MYSDSLKEGSTVPTQVCTIFYIALVSLGLCIIICVCVVLICMMIMTIALLLQT